MRALTTTSVAAGRIDPNTSPCTVATGMAWAGSVTYIRVRTTSSSPNPASPRARSMIARAARAWPAGSPGWSVPGSVVPETQHASPTTVARE